MPTTRSISLEALADPPVRGRSATSSSVIVKADVQGSVEAVVSALNKLSTDRVKVTIVHAGVGGITEGDVNLAVASKAIIIGFNVRPAGKASARRGGRRDPALQHHLQRRRRREGGDGRPPPPTKVEKPLGKAEVRQVFKIQAAASLAAWSSTARSSARVRRASFATASWSGTGKVAGLKRFKDDVKEVTEGFECGITLENYSDIKEGDIVEVFEIEEVKTKLA
jgi:translation initiation factor IF-2